MSLTNSDLDAIKGLVQNTVQPMVDKLGGRIDKVDGKINKLDESLSIMTANGFAEVDKNFAKVNRKLDQMETTLNHVDNRSLAAGDKTDNHEVRISKLEKQPV